MMASYELVRNTNQAVAELGEETDMVAVPETGTFINSCFQSFLATLVALHFTPVSKSASKS